MRIIKNIQNMNLQAEIIIHEKAVLSFRRSYLHLAHEKRKYEKQTVCTCVAWGQFHKELLKTLPIGTILRLGLVPNPKIDP